MGVLPAPEVPDAAVITASGSAREATYAGKSASSTAVGKQPGTAMRLDPSSAARAPGSSGRP